MSRILLKSNLLAEEANSLLESLGLLSIASKYSTPHLIGGVPAGLVVDRDIDISCFIDASLETKQYMAFAKELEEIEEVDSVRVRDQRENPNYSPFKINIDKLNYNGEIWKVAFSFILGALDEENENLKLIALLSKLDDKEKETILKLKEEVLQREKGKIPSYYIYKAVIEEKATTVEDLENYLANNAN